VYAWIWRKLPGAVWSKLSISLGMVAAIGALLWYVIFPWATPLLPFDDVQVESGSGQDAETVIPGDDSAPEELPYSTESNEPHPSSSPGR
jgi:cytoskeletal protein RodZ